MFCLPITAKTDYIFSFRLPVSFRPARLVRLASETLQACRWLLKALIGIRVQRKAFRIAGKLIIRQYLQNEPTLI